MHVQVRREPRGFSLIEVMVVVVIVGVLASLAIYAVRKYVANAKTAEALNSVGQIAKDAQAAFEKDSTASSLLAAKGNIAVVHALCASVSQTVPASIASVKGKKYQPNQGVASDWNVDTATNKGFSCLKFAMLAPQYFLYNYTSDGNQAASPPVVGTQFAAIANGDLNGDGITSTFELIGAVSGSQLYVAPSILQTNPEQ